MTDHRLAVTFFFPYRDVSGVPVLFARLAQQLSTRDSVRVRVIDYADGYQARFLADNARVALTEYVDGTPVSVGANEHLVMQSILPSTIHRELQPDPATRLFFWTLHPMNLVQTIIPTDWGRDIQARQPAWNGRLLSVAMRAHQRMMGQLLIEMHRCGSIAFMDRTTLDSTVDRLGVSLPDPLLLPVPVEMGPGRRRFSAIHGPAEVHVGWLGRLSDFKAHILSYTIRRLAAWAAETETRVTVHVIGDGPKAGLVRAAGAGHRNLCVRFVGTIVGKSLDEYLATEIDVLAAMGTSALEGGRLGIPTILLDVAYGPIRGDYKYRWLFDSMAFGLGDVISDRSYAPGNRTLEEMMATLVENYPALSTSTYSHCLEHHALEHVAATFEAMLRAATFRWGSLSQKVRRKSAVRRAYEWTRRLKRNLGGTQ